MRQYLTILIILLLISTVTATQVDSSVDKRIPIDKKPIRIPINNTNFSINITFPINDTNLTIPINETNLTFPINDTNLSINITLPINETNITVPINETNLSINITRLINETNITIQINETNTTSNNSLLNITCEGIMDLFNITTQNETIELGNKTHTHSTTYFYAGNKLIASEKNDELTYHYQDRLGSDIESHSLPFGQPITIGERFSFTGKEFDQNLHYFGARYYDSNLGKFTSEDPVEKDNPYSYVYNNPINNNDPDGKQTNPVNNQQTNTAELDSLITHTPQDTIQLTRYSTVVADYPNLAPYLRRGVEYFEQALADSLPFEQAVARLDSLSWRGTVPYDTSRTSHANRDSLEEATYGDPNDLPNLSEFFDGTCPDAVCREYVGLTIAGLRIAAERNPEEFNDREISIVNIFGERQNHYRTSAGADSTVTRQIGHAIIAVSDSTSTNLISWGRIYTQPRLETYYEYGTDQDPQWTTGGFDFSNRHTWQNILNLF